MFHPLSIFVGLRYVRARTHKFFVSFITWVSLVGVCVGVAALIVILSVMNGFEGELRDRLLALSPPARIVAASTAPAQAPTAAEWAAAARSVRGVPGVVGVAPYADVEALAVRTPEMMPITLRGIGDRLTLLIPTVAPDGTPEPRLRELTVAGVFEVGLQEHDGTLVFAQV